MHFSTFSQVLGQLSSLFFTVFPHFPRVFMAFPRASPGLRVVRTTAGLPRLRQQQRRGAGGVRRRQRAGAALRQRFREVRA